MGVFRNRIKRAKIKMRIVFKLLLPIALFMAACNNDGPWAVFVSLTPQTAEVNAGKSRLFTAEAVGLKNHDVIWSVQEGEAGGTINQSGVYTAPLTPGVYHVVATSAAFPAERATATVTVRFPPGALDPGFGAGGGVGVPVGPAGRSSQASGLAIQPDGKIVAAGATTDNTFSPPRTDFAFVRLNSDGTLDPAFAGGKKIISFAAGDTAASAVALQLDGKIVAAGSAIAGGGADFALVRVQSDGTLDTTFGNPTGGLVTTDFSSPADLAFAVAIQSDGKIVAAGLTTSGAATDFALSRYNPDGSLDPSFGTGGKVTTNLGTNDAARALAIQADGKIIAAGFAVNGTNSEFALVRYNSNGTLDPSFGTAGKVTTHIGIGDALVNAVAIESDGKIVAAGSATNGLNTDFALARYNPDGTPDAAFGAGGITTTDFSGGNDDANGLRIQPDGKIVAAGAVLGSPGTGDDFGLARYNPDGILDASFGTGGKVITPFGAGDDAAAGVALQADGKIVAAGRASTTPGDVFSFARYWP